MTEQPSRRGPVTRPVYGQDPYVRALCPDAITRDGQAKGWTDTEVLFHTQQDGTGYNAWIPAENVQRISRRESSWQDVNDDWKYFSEQDEM